MKTKIFITMALAVCCANTEAQIVNNENATKFNNLYANDIIPQKFTKDGKSRLVVSKVNNDSFLEIYDSDLKEIASIKAETETYTNYSIIKRREPYEVDMGDGTTMTVYTGDWTEERDDDPESDGGIATLAYMDNGYEPIIFGCVNFRLTQTLFNDDDNYEYITPTYGYAEQDEWDSYQEDRDYDGEIDYIQDYYKSYMSGFKIKSSDGSTLQTVDLNGYTMDYGIGLVGSRTVIMLVNLDEKLYLAVPDVCSYDSEDTFCIFYPINKTGTGINPLGAPVKMKVSPRMADRSQSFTVELDGDSNAEREVVVVNSAGQTVWKRKVPAEQRTVTIGAARLGKGVNVVRVNGGKGAESCKVIVK